MKLRYLIAVCSGDMGSAIAICCNLMEWAKKKKKTYGESKC